MPRNIDCGCHIHVDVESDEEGVACWTGMRPRFADAARLSDELTFGKARIRLPQLSAQGSRGRRPGQPSCSLRRTITTPCGHAETQTVLDTA